MADLSALIDNFFATANETGNLSLTSTTSGGAATVPVTNLGSYYDDGDVVDLGVNPGTATQQVFTGEVSGNNVVNAVWTEGSNVSHSGGSPIKDLRSATHQAALVKGILQEHKQDGTHGDVTADSATVAGTTQTSDLQVDDDADINGDLNVDGALSENSVNVNTIRQNLLGGTDVVASGGVWTQTSGLTGAMTAAVLFIAGKRVAVGAVASKVFTASKDIYIDIGDDGVVDYNEATNGAASPALSASHNRVAVVVTDGSAIVSIRQYNWDSLGNKVYRTLSNINEIAGVTLSGTADAISVTGIPYRQAYRFNLMAVNSGQLNLSTMTFNGDTGSNYPLQRDHDMGASVASTTTVAPVMQAAATDSVSVQGEVFSNYATLPKSGRFLTLERNGAGVTAPTSRLVYFKWVNLTAAISRMDFNNTGTGDLAAGTNLTIFAP